MPLLVLVAGAAGSGKTTVGNALAERSGFLMADFDVVSATVVAAYRAAHPEVDEPAALAHLREDRYRALADHVREAHAADPGIGIVAAAPFSRELASAAAWADWVAATGWPVDEVLTVALVLDPAERYRRMAGRGSSRDVDVLAASPDDLPPAPAPAVPCLLVDAGRPVADQVDQVMSQFDNG